MSTRRVSITARIAVTVVCDAEDHNGEVNVVSVRHVSLPTATEVMEALDADDALGELDAAYAAAAIGDQP
jgi:hypothetical protein